MQGFIPPRPGMVRLMRERLIEIEAGQVRMDCGAGRIGFMSTQRREDRRCWSCMEGAWAFGPGVSRSFARHGHAGANGGTAPPDYHPSNEDLSQGAPDFQPGSQDLSLRAQDFPVRMATNSLRGNLKNFEITWLAGRESRRAAPGAPSHPAYPIPAGLSRIHSALPQFPARRVCRTERYDGKRDLYFQHAARNTACNS